MRRYISMAVLAAVCAPMAWGQTPRDGRVPGMSQADVHNPFSPRYNSLTPGGSLGMYWPSAPGTTYSRGNYYSYGNGYYGSPYGYGGYDYGPGFYGDGFYPPPYGYGASYGYGGSFGTYPLVIPAENVFGLGPVMRMLGAVNPAPLVAPLGPNMAMPNAPLAAAPNVVPNAGAQAVPAAPIVQGAPPANGPLRVRASNAEQLARAGRYLGSGDADFAKQEYRQANANYRKATETAPDLVPAFLRQGQALLATGQYELAAKAFRRGLRLGPGWSKSDFILADLYGDNRLAQQNHMEALAAAAGDQPQNADLLLLVGLELHFGGQQERAVQFFQKFAALLPDEELHLAEVLK